MLPERGAVIRGLVKRTDKLMKSDETAEQLGVKKSTIYRWTHEESIPDLRIGRFVRFKANVELRWLNSQMSNGRETCWIDKRTFS